MRGWGWASTAIAVLLGVGVGTWLARRDPRLVASDREVPRGEAAPGADGSVECQIDPAPGPRRVALEEHDPDDLSVLGALPVTIDGEWIRFRPLHPDGVGRLFVDGFRPFSFGWTGGACLDLLTPEPSATTWVYGRVVGPAAELSVTGCGRATPLDPDGTFELELAADASCDVGVERIFGTQRLVASTVTVRPRPGEAIELTLAAPEPPGAAGWDLLATDDGFRVAAVTPGGAAAGAGIGVADRVVALGGRPAGAWVVDEARVVALPVEVSVTDADGAHPRDLQLGP